MKLEITMDLEQPMSAQEMQAVGPILVEALRMWQRGGGYRDGVIFGVAYKMEQSLAATPPMVRWQVPPRDPDPALPPLGAPPRLCDGCNVVTAWEHRCHGNSAHVHGESTRLPCECPGAICLLRRNLGTAP